MEGAPTLSRDMAKRGWILHECVDGAGEFDISLFEAVSPLVKGAKWLRGMNEQYVYGKALGNRMKEWSKSVLGQQHAEHILANQRDFYRLHQQLADSKLKLMFFGTIWHYPRTILEPIPIVPVLRWTEVNKDPRWVMDFEEFESEFYHETDLVAVLK